MPHANPVGLPNGRWPSSTHRFRSAHWGDMEAGYTVFDHVLDTTEVNKIGGLPGGVCPCPHYGYVLEGAITVSYPGIDWPDETATAGEVYFFPAGHVLNYPEPTRHLECRPAYALQQCMAGMERVAGASRARTIVITL